MKSCSIGALLQTKSPIEKVYGDANYSEPNATLCENFSWSGNCFISRGDAKNFFTETSSLKKKMKLLSLTFSEWHE